MRSVGEPILFIEYASGIDPDLFIQLFSEIQSFAHISACIDIGHLGLWQAKKTYGDRHPGEDIFALKPDDPRLPGVIEDILQSVSSAPETVLRVVRKIGGFGKPVHFHLHDAHPLSVSSPFGISDHLSFSRKGPYTLCIQRQELSRSDVRPFRPFKNHPGSN